jgi:hypothetical protein
MEMREKKYFAGDRLSHWFKATVSDTREPWVLRFSAINLKVHLTNIRVIPVLETTVAPQSRDSVMTAGGAK